MSGRIPEEVLEELRKIPPSEVFERLGLFWKADADFSPLKNKQTYRVRVEKASGQIVELTFTGLKWFDRLGDDGRGVGGGGAIDLAVYLGNLSFRRAVSLLRRNRPKGKIFPKKEHGS